MQDNLQAQYRLLNSISREALSIGHRRPTRKSKVAKDPFHYFHSVHISLSDAGLGFVLHKAKRCAFLSNCGWSRRHSMCYLTFPTGVG
jgi:hypothetical protein